MLYENLNKNYIDNNGHYIPIHVSSEVITEKLVSARDKVLSVLDSKSKRRYIRKGFSCPYGYIIPKNKDINKYRPVVSYVNHVSKKY